MKYVTQHKSAPALIAVGMVLSVATYAVPLCVNPAPNAPAGCYSTIGAAVTAAAAGSTIQVAAGTYKEGVTITKTLALIGVPGQTIVDATGKSNGFFINGTATAPSASVSGVVISGFTVKNANFEGILVANAVGVTIQGNTVILNDKSLQYSANSTCPGQPTFETEEGDDCGEGIHLIAVDHSVVANNVVEENAGGILITDETGPTFENLITGNTVADNVYDCGITMASHTPAPNLPQGLSYGIFNNTISGNTVRGNGTIGQGAGVGIFAPGPGAANYQNVVIGNVLTENGIGGVTMHNHAAAGVAGVPAQAPPFNMNNNVIVGNQIAGNMGDSDDPNSPGPTGISILSFGPVLGTVISQNTFGDEIADVTFNAPSGSIQAHLNNFTANAIAVDSEASGSVDASQNFFGCPAGPGGPGCATIMGPNVVVSSWLPAPFGGARSPRGF